jgi:hypothetical protein
MKTLIYLPIILFCFLSFQFHGQTFSNTTVSSTGSWDVTLNKTIVVSGIGVLSNAASVLKQVNIHLGGPSESTRNFGTYTIKLISPAAGNPSITIVSTSSFPTTFYTEFDSKFRDHPSLQFPSTTAGSDLACPWDIGYYRTVTSNDFSTFNGTNANGTWTISISETSSSSGAKFDSADLIFGTPFIISSANLSNNTCSTPQCVDAVSIMTVNINTTINGYTGNNSTDPIVSSPYPSGCNWNGSRDNTSWFFFRPSGTTAKITVSGIQDAIQALVVNPTNNCTSGSQTVPTGGCPISAVNDTYNSPRYTGSAGSSANLQFNLSGLTAGSNYYLVVDGVGGNVSNLYIELMGGLTTCSILLPIELTNLDYSCDNEILKLEWITAAETNNSHFTILGSSDANEWMVVGIVNGAGNSLKTINYNYDVPAEFSGLKYFKLSQTDFDGTTSFSSILFTDCEKYNHVDFFPNPFNNEINFTLKSNESVPYEITTVLGQVVNSGIISTENSRISLDDLASDIYFIKIDNSKVHKIIKQK